MDIIKALEQEFKLKTYQVQNVVKLIDEDNTIPFIARYRKELTGSLDDQVLREMHERLIYLRGMDERREQIRKRVIELDKMTDELAATIDNATTLAELEDIYRPYKPKRRTRATIAKEKGLEPLALLIWAQEITEPVENLAQGYINPELGVEDAAAALAGAGDIIAEIISDDAKYRQIVRQYIWDTGLVKSVATDPEKTSVYEMYYDFNEPVNKIAGHRVLAINRGEKEEYLKVTLEINEEILLRLLYHDILKNNTYTKAFLINVIDDSYHRLVAPSVEREIRSALTETAEDNAIKVFAENLRQLILQPPIKDKIVLAVDPGFRTGCKISVIDGTGKVLDTAVIYATIEKDTTKSGNIIKSLVDKHNVEIIAIGNGTASRESEQFVADFIQHYPRKLYYVIVNEAGASVYSASKLGAQEFPDFDVSLRSAVSIGRRLQDPMAELVKIDPKSIGVGQYQHDMNQKKLGESLGGVVESCVNTVGVDLNTASPALLSYVSGISATVANNILEYREEIGRFTTRKQLLKVKKLGPKLFEQCAGFLRIPEGKHPLDNTAVHPESYEAAEALLKSMGYSLEDVKNKRLQDLRSRIEHMSMSLNDMAKQLNVGLPTIKDIISELEKPGRDPREDMPPVVLRSDVLSMEDLYEGMVLQGTVRNIVDFGAFVDIGVHQDGLVHISQIADKYVKHPMQVVSVGDIVDVKVVSVDVAKKRIALSMRGVGKE